MRKYRVGNDYGTTGKKTPETDTTSFHNNSQSLTRSNGNRTGEAAI
jgi:hypothetical protein